MKFLEKYKLVFIVGITCLFVGRFVLTPKQEVQVKEVIKYVENKKEDKKTNTTVVIREEKKPDGTVVKETTTSESSQITTASSQNYSNKSSKISKSGTSISIGALILKDINDFKKQQEYAILTKVPVFGNISVIGTLDTSKRAGIGISLDF